ncbi:hypothetical protein GCM10012320_11410 [Sinomonas cellulolyticus]|nr:hypothetical protein GCM10012320_11410 [Sinomonas sp. KCTC 49339]
MEGKSKRSHGKAGDGDPAVPFEDHCGQQGAEDKEDGASGAPNDHRCRRDASARAAHAVAAHFANGPRRFRLHAAQEPADEE